MDEIRTLRVRHKFDVGLTPKLGDPVWLLSSGVATTVPPDGYGLASKAMYYLKLKRRPITIRLGVIIDCSTYFDDFHCVVLYT